VPRPRRNGLSKEDQQAANRRREEASGVLRIFGLAPQVRDPRKQELLSEREREVADLLAMGFTNRAIARHLNVSSATVSSHVAHILSKLGFRSRAQVAAWVAARIRPRPSLTSQCRLGRRWVADGSPNLPV
jgi:DNA-binding NarL/FixJ family response regulator